MSILFLIKRKTYSRFLSLSLIIIFLTMAKSGFGYPLYPQPPKTTEVAKGTPSRYPNPPKNVKGIKNKKPEYVMPPLPVYKRKFSMRIPSSVNALHLTIKPGQTKTVYLSKKFINRIVFNHYVTYAKTSKTGDVSITLNKKDAVVVFSPYMIESGAVKKIVYPKVPSSVLFNVGNSTVSLLLVPKNIPPQTIYINKIGGANNRQFHSNGGFSKYVAKVFKTVYAGRAPKGYLPETENKTYKTNYPQIEIKLVKEYKGARFNVYVYRLKNLSNGEVSLSNKEFLNLRSKILAISLSEEHLFKNTYTRLLIMGVNNVWSTTRG